jgi:hypothetical protein
MVASLTAGLPPWPVSVLVPCLFMTISFAEVQPIDLPIQQEQ